MRGHIMISCRAFTIMEIMVVIVILGAIAGFAIPNYTKSVEQAYERDAIMQLSAIHATNQIYFAKTGAYWPPNGSAYDVNSINSNLNLNIIENGMTYSCTGTNGTTFTCTAVRSGAAAFTVTVTEAALTATNPDCTSGACP